MRTHLPTGQRWRMGAASGRLYLATTNGKVVCFGKDQ